MTEEEKNDVKTESGMSLSPEQRGREELVGRFIARGKEVVGFFDGAAKAEPEEYGFINERLNEKWRTDIPVSDHDVLEAVFSGRKDDVMSEGASAISLYVRDENVSEDGIRFEVYGRTTRGGFVESVVKITTSERGSSIEIVRGRTQAENFDEFAGPTRHILTQDGTGSSVGQAELITESQIDSPNNELVIQKTHSRKLVVVD